MMNDHERTVAEARANMALADQRRPLERWLQNYVHPALGVPAAYWCAVTRTDKRWKVEFGLLASTTVAAWCMADPGAPEPPILEFRRPKPEPVKPRWQSPQARMVASFDLLVGDFSRALADRFLQTGLTTQTARATAEEGFTIAKLMEALESLPPELRQRPRVELPVHRPFRFELSEHIERVNGNIATLWVETAIRSMAPAVLSAHLLEQLRALESPPEALKKPPPAPSKRNQ